MRCIWGALRPTPRHPSKRAVRVPLSTSLKPNIFHLDSDGFDGVLCYAKQTTSLADESMSVNLKSSLYFLYVLYILCTFYSYLNNESEFTKLTNN